MLIKFEFENFKSFKNRTIVSMKCGNSKKYDSNSYIENKYGRFNKVLFIYGKNSAGKSNLLEAFQFLLFFTLNQQMPSKQIADVVKYRKYIYDSTCLEKPISFSIEFLTDDRLYLFDLSVDSKGIIYEKLSFRKEKSHDYKYIYISDNLSISFNRNIISEEKIRVLKYLTPTYDQSYISKMSNINFVDVDIIENAYVWIDKVKIINAIENRQLTNKYMSFLKNSMDSEDYEVDVKLLNEFDIDLSSLGIEKNEVNSSFSLYSRGINERNEEVKLPFEFESNGTKKLLYILSILYKEAKKITVVCLLLMN